MPSIIGWIKNGRKGKNLAYMPASYPSERVAYGNGSVKDELDELNADLDWKTWKTNEPTDASTNVALPSSFKELLIDVKGAQNYIVGNFYVNAKRLSTTETLYRSGYYEESQYNGEAILWVSTTTARGRVLENNAQSRTTTLDIYYR